MMDAQVRNTLNAIKPEDRRKMDHTDPTKVDDANATEALTNEIDAIFHRTHPPQKASKWYAHLRLSREVLHIHI